MYMYSEWSRDEAVLPHLGLERAPQANHKRVLCEGEDVSLVKNLLNLFLHDHAILADFLHGKTFSCLFVAY